MDTSEPVVDYAPQPAQAPAQHRPPAADPQPDPAPLTTPQLPPGPRLPRLLQTAW